MALWPGFSSHFSSTCLELPQAVRFIFPSCSGWEAGHWGHLGLCKSHHEQTSRKHGELSLSLAGSSGRTKLKQCKEESNRRW